MNTAEDNRAWIRDTLREKDPYLAGWLDAITHLAGPAGILTPGGVRSFATGPDPSYLASLDAEYGTTPEGDAAA